jgi:hypothetical protein
MGMAEEVAFSSNLAFQVMPVLSADLKQGRALRVCEKEAYLKTLHGFKGFGEGFHLSSKSVGREQVRDRTSC